MDFHAQLNKQLDFLTTSCAAYDAGSKDEGVRIATSLRVLFHQTRNSTSLLTYLHAQNITLLSTCEGVRPGARFWPNITDIRLIPPHLVAEFIPKLDTAKSKRYVHFRTWWDREPIYVTHHKGRRISLTRRDIALAAANTDGGAHVDSALGAEYEYILEGAGWSMTWNPEDGSPSTEVKFQYAHLSALRQMAYEVLHSPDVLRLRDSSTPSLLTS
jgi:hypothetical protein